MIDEENEPLTTADLPEDVIKRGPYRTTNKRVEEKLEVAMRKIEALEKMRDQLVSNNQVSSVNAEVQQTAYELEQAMLGEDPAKVREAVDKRYMALRKWEQAQQTTIRVPNETRKKNTPELKRWNEENSWIDDPTYAEEAQVTNLINEKLARQWAVEYGEDTLYSRSYFDELNQLLAKNEKTKRVITNDRPERGRMVAGANGNTTVGRSKNFDKVLENAKRAGINTDDPAEVKKLQYQFDKVVKRMQEERSGDDL